MEKQNHFAAVMLVAGCILFGLGSLIVKFVPVGGYAIAFWRLLIASAIFWFLMKLKRRRFPKSKKAILYAVLSGVFFSLLSGLLARKYLCRRTGYFHFVK